MSSRGNDRDGNNQHGSDKAAQRGRRNRRAKGKGGGAGGPGKQSSGRGRSQRDRRKRGGPQRQHDAAAFWGDPGRLPESQSDLRITDDAAAVPRSLGTPPLPGHERIAEHYFAAVYDRAVTTAGALAAAGGLIDPTALAEELAD